MRELTTAQEDLLLGTRFGVYAKLEVQTSTSTGAYTDLSTYGGHDWLVRAMVDVDIDQPVSEARFFVRREVSSSESLAPLNVASTFNQDSCSEPIIDVNREVKLSVATIAASCSPGSTDFVLLWRGDIDSFNSARNPMELRCRDPGSVLTDQWVETSTAEYSTSSTGALSTVMQDILNDWTTPTPTLLVHPTTPGFILTNGDDDVFAPGQRPVMEVQQQLAGLVGYDLRYYWSSSGEDFQLTLRDPGRGTTEVPDSTFGPDRYIDVTQLELDRTRVRNAVNIRYPDADSTAFANELVESTSSQSRFGRRWMEIEEASNSQLDTSSEANAFAQAILDDLEAAVANQEVDMDFFWPVELGDVYRWEANNVHYDTDQDLAVTGYQHELSENRNRTKMRVRNRPSGGYMRWLKWRHYTPVRFGGLVSWAWDLDNDIIISITAADVHTHGAYFELSTGSTFVEPSTSSTFVSRSEMPYSQDQGVSVLSTDTAYLWVKFWNDARRFGMSFKERITQGTGAAQLKSADCTVLDDDADLTYQFTWVPDVGVTDADHDVLCEAAHSTGVFPEVSSSQASPVTTKSKTITDNGAGDGVHQNHDWTVTLTNSTGGTIHSISGTVQSTSEA